MVLQKQIMPYLLAERGQHLCLQISLYNDSLYFTGQIHPIQFASLNKSVIIVIFSIGQLPIKRLSVKSVTLFL
ncbi:hypothetical protein D3C78_1043710 [compost metagenome]